jgi:hypothetical protein
MALYVGEIEDDAVEVSSETYPEIRQILAPEYRDASSEEIEAIIEDAFGEDISAEELEEYLEGLDSLLSQGLSLGGAALGGMLGGPIGATLGKAAGGAAAKGIGYLTSKGKRRRRKPKVSRKRRIKQSRQRPQIAKRGLRKGRRPTSPRTSTAAAQLLQMLSKPNVMKILTAIAAGQAGQKSFRIAGRSVPVGAIPNVISTLANQVAEEYQAIAPLDGEAFPEYLLDADGEFLVDPAVPEERAQLVMELLEEDSWLASMDEDDEEEDVDDDFTDKEEGYDRQLEELRDAVQMILDDYYDDLDEDEDEVWDEEDFFEDD